MWKTRLLKTGQICRANENWVEFPLLGSRSANILFKWNENRILQFFNFAILQLLWRRRWEGMQVVQTNLSSWPGGQPAASLFWKGVQIFIKWIGLIKIHKIYENIKGLKDFMTWSLRYYKVDLRTITLGVPPQEVRKRWH